jgi:hypothetical protein
MSNLRRHRVELGIADGNDAMSFGQRCALSANDAFALGKCCVLLGKLLQSVDITGSVRTSQRTYF